MTTLEAFLLGLIQGITEFLPVSSSGHLALGQYFLGFENLQDYVFFDLICHLGTLAAICYVFFPAIKDSLNIRKASFWQVVLGTLPLFPLVLVLKPIKSLYNQPQFLGPFFLLSACLIFAGSYLRFPLRIKSKSKWQECVAIGIFQAIAILPGISRSGATISAARFIGWEKEAAIRYSFLLAIPAILGGVTLESWQIFRNPSLVTSTIDPWVFFVGFFTSFIVGCVSLWLLIRLVGQDKWSWFGWYCLLVGISTSLYFI